MQGFSSSYHRVSKVFGTTRSNKNLVSEHDHLPKIIQTNPFRSKSRLRPCGTRAGDEFQSQIYPLSINTRITRENCAKNNHNFNPPKQAPPNGLPQPFPHTRSPKQGIKTKPCLTGGWPHFVKPSTPHKFFNRWCRQSLNRNPKGDPHDLAFDEINSRRWHHAFNGL